MTTFDDTDLFTDAFHDFRGVGDARRRSGWLTALVLVAAAALVAGGMVWVKLAQHTAALVDPQTTLAAFADPQRSVDVVAADDLAGSMIDPATTRLVAHTADTRYYAGVSRAHLLCVLAVTTGELPTTSCTSATAAGANLTVDDALRIVTRGPAPAAADGWHEAGPQVYLKD